MRNVLRLLTLPIVAALGGAVQAAPAPIVRVEPVPAAILPGLPVNVVVTVTNPGEQPVEVANYIRMHVIPSSGQPFVVIADESSSPKDYFALVDANGPSLTRAAGETKTFVRAVDPTLAGPEFFWDERLSFPGQYRLRVELRYGSEPALETLLSSETTLTVVQPLGPDAIVWKHMLELTAGRGWSGNDWVNMYGAMTRFVLENAPNSGYFPYVAHLKVGRTESEVREGIERAIALQPEGPVADSLKGALAGWYLGEARDALQSADLDGATQLIAEAKRLVVEISRTTPYPWIRENTERWLAEEHLFNEGVVRGMYASKVTAMSSFTEPVTPVVECVDPGVSPEEPYIIWFGYSNPNRGAKFVEPGRENRLIPSASQQPPRVFQPGSTRYGFSVTTHAEQVTWNINHRSVTATRTTQPRCALPNALLFLAALRPVVECIQTNGDNVVVQFGYENPNNVAIRLAVGENNQLAGTNEQPPVIFEPGRHYNAFRVKVKNSETVRWSLAGRTVNSNSTSVATLCRQ